MIPPDLQRGDYVDCYWADPCLDETGDPTTATMALHGSQPFRVASGRFWERRVNSIRDPKTRRSLEVPVIILTFSFDPDSPAQQGYRIIPESLVAGVEIIKRMRRPKKVKDAQVPTP